MANKKDKNLLYCNQLNIDIAKDPDWKDINGKTDLNEPDDIYSYMNIKAGSDANWFSIEEHGEYNSFLIIDQAPDKNGRSPSITIVHLYDSRDKESVKELEKITPISFEPYDIDISKDADWKDCQEKDTTLSDMYDAESFIHTKFGNDVDWVSLEENKADTFLIIDQAPDKNGRSPSLKILNLKDSREQKRSKGCK